MDLLQSSPSRPSGRVNTSTADAAHDAVTHPVPFCPARFALSEHDEEPWVYTVEEAGERLRIGRTKAYDMAGQYEKTGGREGLPVIRLGNCLRVPRWALLELAELGRVVSLPELAAHADRRKRSIRRQIRVRRAVRAAAGTARRPRSSAARSARRPARSPGGRRGSVDQLVLVPAD